jgi:Domain of Unknown Function with PDB structure (DUF3857)
MQTPPKSLAPPDYSQEAFVIEEFTHKAKFENDGTAVEEDAARVRVQSGAGVEHYGLLSFSYASGVGPFEVVYVRVRKPDGTVVETPRDTFQDMPAEITRQAPFYSDLHEIHVAVKGLGIGDVLEYKFTTHVSNPLTPGQFSLMYSFTRDSILLKEQLEVSVPAQRAIKFKSPEQQPVVSDSGGYRVYTWSHSNLSRRDTNAALLEFEANYHQQTGRFPPSDVQLTSFESWPDQDLVLRLASYWGTLGWVQLRLGHSPDAEKYLTASWKLTQNGIAAAHLCVLYMQQHRNNQALQMCRLACNRLALESDPASYHLSKLIVQNNARLEQISPGSSKTWNMSTIDEVVHMRDYKIPRALAFTASADFLLLIDYDPQTAKFLVRDVTFLEGSDKLKPYSASLDKLSFSFSSPNNNPVRFLRRGTFLCSGNAPCEFLLLDAIAHPGRTVVLNPVHNP